MPEDRDHLIARCKILEQLAHRALLALDEDDFPELRQDLRNALGIEDDEPTCTRCGGPIYSQPHWSHWKCDDCGYSEKKAEMEP
jgi:ribosomal protein S27AE